MKLNIKQPSDFDFLIKELNETDELNYLLINTKNNETLEPILR